MSLLELEGVTKRFGGVAAVRDVSLSVDEGTLLGIIGPNGAGKSTLINLISRLLPCTEGRIAFAGRTITRLAPHRMSQLGIARTFQVVKPLHRMNVEENVMVGALFGEGRRRRGLVREVRRLVEEVGLGDVGHKDPAELTPSQRKRMELARALAANPRLLLIDELFSGLDPSEIEVLKNLIVRIRRERPLTILMVEHAVGALVSISDLLLVLRHGSNIAYGKPEEVIRQPEVITAYLGRHDIVEQVSSSGESGDAGRAN